MDKRTKILSLMAATSIAGTAFSVAYVNDWEYKTIRSLQTNKLFNANVSRDKEKMPFVLEPGAVYDPVAETVTVSNVGQTKVGRYGISLFPDPASLLDPEGTVTIDSFSGYWHINTAGNLVFKVTADVTPGGTRGFNYEFKGPYPVDFVVDTGFKKTSQKLVVNEKSEMITGSTHKLNVTNDILDATGLSNITFTSSNPNVLSVSSDGTLQANATLTAEQTATITITGDKTFLHNKPADYTFTVKVIPETLSLRADAPTVPGIYEDGDLLNTKTIDLTNVQLVAGSTGATHTGNWAFKTPTDKSSVLNNTTTLVFTSSAQGVKPFEIDVPINVMKTLTLNAASGTKTYDNTTAATKDMLDTRNLTGVNPVHTAVAVDTITANFAQANAGTTTITITGITLTGTGSDRYRFATGNITLPAEITKAPINSSNLRPKIEKKIKAGESIKADDILENISVLASGDTIDKVMSEVPTNNMSMDVKKKIL